MLVLIFGTTGQLGRELAHIPWSAGVTIKHLDRTQCDLAVASDAGATVLATAPDIVINAAAHTAVDRAESEPDIAAAINRDAPAAMADACRAVGAKLIHVSTDYVFDGRKGTPYTESDPIAPLSVYGHTKERGEAAIRARLPEHVILRTSWVFAAHGANFVRTMLRVAGERSELRIVADQQGSPTAARDIAKAIAVIVDRIGAGRFVSGTFHFASSEATSWLDFAQAIFALRGSGPRLVPITTAEYKAPAQRPLYSVLDCARIGETYGIAQPSWRQALADVMSELGEEANAKRVLAE